MLHSQFLYVTKREANTLSSVVEVFQQNGTCYVSELQSIRNELRKQKSIKALIEYHKNFSKYLNFPNITMSDSEDFHKF